MPENMGRNESIPFQNPKLIPILIGVFLFLFFGGILLVIFLDTPAHRPAPNSENYSALGHHAFVRILKEAGLKVFRSHYFSYLVPSYDYYEKRQETVAFVEPDTDKWYEYTQQNFNHSLRQILLQGNHVILVCPKWEGRGVHPEKRQWVSGYRLVHYSHCDELLQYLDIPLKIHRRLVEETQILDDANRKYTILSDSFQYFSISSNARVNPEILAQTVNGAPVVCRFHSFAGVGGSLIVVSDPDFLNNMGIGQKDNGIFIVSLLRQCIKDQNLWIDEVCHGLGYPPSIIRALLSYPAVCVTLQSLLIGIFLAWLAGVRFHPPLPEPRRSRSLEEQITAFSNITCSSDKHNYFLQRYLKSILQELTEYYPAIASMPIAKKVQYLDEVGKSRKTRYQLSLLYDKSMKSKKPGNIAILAKAIQQWKTEMIPHVSRWKNK